MKFRSILNSLFCFICNLLHPFPFIWFYTPLNFSVLFRILRPKLSLDFFWSWAENISVDFFPLVYKVPWFVTNPWFVPLSRSSRTLSATSVYVFSIIWKSRPISLSSSFIASPPSSSTWYLFFRATLNVFKMYSVHTVYIHSSFRSSWCFWSVPVAYWARWHPVGFGHCTS